MYVVDAEGDHLGLLKALVRFLVLTIFFKLFGIFFYLLSMLFLYHIIHFVNDLSSHNDC